MNKTPQKKIESEVGKTSGPFLSINRGTNDDLEILRDIVAKTPAVRTKVLIKLREAKARLLKKPAND